MNDLSMFIRSAIFDCQGNGIPDWQDIDDDPSLDLNGNGDIDECEPLCYGWPGEGPCGACCVEGGRCFAFTSYESCTNILGGTYCGDLSECPRQAIEVAIVEPGGDIFIHVIAAPVTECSCGRRDRDDCVEGELIDPWKSDSTGGGMCQRFGVPGSPVIPAGFFGPGSDPFDGLICLEGVPLGPTAWGEFGDADTLIRRTADPFDRCSLLADPPAQAQVGAEIVALSLQGVAPMTVYYGGANPENWSVTVDLSEVDQLMGSVTATKTHCNGGTYTSTLFVHARFTFTKVGDPSQVRILDTGLAPGFDPVMLNATTPREWVHVVNQDLGVDNPLCTDFHVGVRDFEKVSDCDCNGNLINDACDLDPDDPDGNGKISADCNANRVPDECEPDCNGNGIPDHCDVDPADPDGDGQVSANCNYNNAVPDECDIDPTDPDGNGVVSADCNANGIPDECDVNPLDPDGNGQVSADSNGNGVPDECEDCNHNGIVDPWDVDPTDPDGNGGVSSDCNANGIPDECEVASTTDLGTLGGDVYVEDMNAAGQIVGVAITPEYGSRTFLWLPDPAYGLPAGMNHLEAIGDTLAVRAITDAGHIIGDFYDPGSGRTDAFVWANGVMTDLGSLGGYSSSASAANELGQVTGFAQTATGAQHAFLWLPAPAYGLPAGMNDLGTLVGDYSFAEDINERGQVVGHNSSRAFIWLPEPAYGLDAGMHDLGTLGGYWSVARAMNDRGEVVGEARTVTSQNHAFLWLPEAAYGLPAGMNDIDTLGSMGSLAFVINEKGHVAGDLDGVSAAGVFLWKDGTMIDLGTLGGTSSHVLAMNEADQIVGQFYPPLSDYGRAFLWTNGELLDLNKFVAPGSSQFLDSAVAINEAGRIATNATLTAGGSRGILLTLNGAAVDCNVNGVPDDCDIDPSDPDGNGKVSADCNANDIPDDCEMDCNANGVPDECDIDPTDPDGNGEVSGDCNANLVLDECDIGTVWGGHCTGPNCSQDCNGNGVPDECDVVEGFFIDLGTLGGDDSWSSVYGMNDAGQIVGDARTAAYEQHAFLWLPDPAYGLPAGMNDLGALGGSYSRANAITEAGQVIGQFAVAGEHGFVWANGVMTNLGSLGGDYSQANAVNESGQVVGGAWTAAYYEHAFLWLPEAAYGLPAGMNDLGTLYGDFSTAEDINEHGQVVGNSESIGGFGHAFLWLSEPAYGMAAGMHDLGTLGGNVSMAYAINDRGQVIGESETVTSQIHAFLWLPEAAYGLPAGMNDIDTLGSQFSHAIAINENGHVIGQRMDSSAEHAFLWRDGTMVDLGALGGTWSYARAINDAGQVVGMFGPMANAPNHAFLWADGEMVDLNEFLPPGASGILIEAVAINQTGWIAATGTLTAGGFRSYLLALGGTSEDCNANGVPDECDADCNTNEIPDDCEYPDCPGILPGDFNCDGLVDTYDVPVFVSFLLSGRSSCQADVNRDGMVNGLDIADFVALVTP